MITYNPRGNLIRTAGPAETRKRAADADAPYLTEAGQIEELTPGSCAVIDIDDISLDDAEWLAARTRARGIGLTVAARPNTGVPHRISRNLEPEATSETA